MRSHRGFRAWLAHFHGFRTTPERKGLPRQAHRILELEALEGRIVPDAATPCDVIGPSPAAAYTPSQIRAAYGIPSMTVATGATPVTIAIVDAFNDPTIQGDLTEFDTAYGLTPDPPLTVYNQSGQDITSYLQDSGETVSGVIVPPVDDGTYSGFPGTWESEEALDVEWAHAIAPAASIKLVETTTPNLDDLLTAAQFAGARSGAQVVCMNWAENEDSVFSSINPINNFSDEQTKDSTFVQPSSYGITYLAPTGDDGDDGGSKYPVSSPDVLAVGGTTLQLDGSGNREPSTPESAWDNYAITNDTMLGTAGHPSLYEAQPNYQAGIVPTSFSINPKNGLEGRTTADVSFDGDPTTGVSVYNSYGQDPNNSSFQPWFQVGGTSVACTCWVGLIAIADQDRANLRLPSLNGASQALPTLYNLPGGAFNDIINGHNENYPAQAGYDNPTGIGTPVANPLVSDLTEMLPAWTVGKSGYSQTLGAPISGTAPFTFVQAGGTLPSGLNLSSAGILSGTPTGTGKFSFTTTVTDANTTPTSLTWTVIINPSLSIAPATLSGVAVNQTGYQFVTTTGGTGPRTTMSIQGTVPPGLTFLNAGLLAGTPTVTGSYTFTLTTADATGDSASKSFTVNVFTFSPATLPDGTVDTAGYNQTITASGGASPYTFIVTEGKLPPGLTLSSSGVLSGKPTVVGSYSFIITAGDSNGASAGYYYTIPIDPIVTITTTSLLNLTENRSTSQSISASGGTPSLTFALTSGSLPTGISISSTGVLSGTPTASGRYLFTVTATDALGESGSHTYVLYSFAFTPASLPKWTTKVVGYSQTVSVSGGTAPYSYLVSSGTLPTGLSLSATGVLSGTPTVAGSYPFTVQTGDRYSQTGNQTYTVVINPPVTFTTTTLSNWTVNASAYNQTVQTTGGTGSDTFVITSGTLPTGLSLSSTGILSGTPSVQATFTFQITATDTIGAQGTGSYTLVINPPVMITTTTLPNWTANLAFSQTITATGGTSASGTATGPYTWSTTGGTLPTGLTLNVTTGVLSGTPTTARTYTFIITATDSVGAIATQAYTVTINAAVSIITTTLPAWTSQFAYNETISATGGTGTLTFSASGTLPTGLALSTAGVLSGTPTTQRTYNFTVVATDAVGASRSYTYAVTVNAALQLPSLAVPYFDKTGNNLMFPYSQSISATGGTGTVALTLSNVSSPIDGLTGPTPVGPNLLTIAGTPTGNGNTTQSFTVTATDSIGASTMISYVLTAVQATVLYLPIPGTTTAGHNVMAYPISINQLRDEASTSHEGLMSATIALSFNTGVFSFPVGAGMATSDVSFGSVLSGGAANWNLSATSTADGQLNINLSAKTNKQIPGDNPAGGGSLVLVNFPFSQGYNVSIPLNVTITLASSNGSGHTQIIGSNGPYVFAPGLPYSSSIIVNPRPSITGLQASTAFMDLISFSNGANPRGGLVEDADGNLIGTTYNGGAYGDGSIFEMLYNSYTGTYGNPITLVNLDGSNGANPYAGLYMDAYGNVFRTTTEGTLFEMEYYPWWDGGPSYSFQALAGLGGSSYGGVVEDNNGDLFGTTSNGGPYGDGTVFELQTMAYDPGSNYTVYYNNITTLANFDYDNGDSHSGAHPMGNIIMDGQGNLYGTTVSGGTSGDGTVFEVPYIIDEYGSPQFLSFNGANGGGAGPEGGVVADSNGNLYGTAGGGATGAGMIFEVPSSFNGISTLANFDSSTGASPLSGVIIDPHSGNLYGTTVYGTVGTVFELASGSSTITTLYSFSGADGENPTAGLFEDNYGNLYGVTAYGGSNNGGTVFLVDTQANAIVGQSFNQTLQGMGGTGTLTFSYSGQLPTGLNLSSTGVLSGTLTTAGTYSFVLTVTDSLGVSSSLYVTLTVAPQ